MMTGIAGKVGIGALFLSALAMPAQGILLIDERFNYTPGNITDDEKWTAVNQEGNGPIQVLSGGSLELAPHRAPLGNRLRVTDSGSEDVGRDLPYPLAEGPLYYSFLMNVTGPPDGVTYGPHLRSGSAYCGRVFIDDLDGTFRIGVSNGASVGEWAGGSLAYNETQFVVLRMDFGPGQSTVSRLYVNPDITAGAEPAADASHTGSEVTGVERFVFRQTSATGVVEYDDLRMGTSWEAVTNSVEPDPLLAAGEHVPVGAEDGIGILGGYTGYIPSPAGTLDAFGNGPHDLVMRNGFVYPFLGFHESGSPLFGEPQEIGRSAGLLSIVHAPDGEAYALQRTGTSVRVRRFNQSSLSFLDVAQRDVGVSITGMAGFVGGNGNLHVFHTQSDGLSYHPTDYGSHDPRYRPFDGAGFWRGNIHWNFLNYTQFSSVNLGAPLVSTQVTPDTREILFQTGGSTVVQLGSGYQNDLVSADKHGVLRYFRNTSAGGGVAIGRPAFIRDRRDVALRHPIINPTPAAFPNPGTGLSDLIIGDTATTWYYAFSGEFGADGSPIYEDRLPVLATNTHVATGALPVISTGDMTGNGLIDILIGNDAGAFLYARNIGEPGAPAFAPPEPLMIGGSELFIQAGYRGSVQGPGERTWGYSCPSLYDWTGSGELDIITNTIRGDYLLMRRVPGSDPPAFEKPRPLFVDGLNLRGTWRAQPALTDWGLGGRTSMVALDHDNLLRVYWQLDEYNLEEGDVLRLENGDPVRVSSRGAGQWGRSKLQVVDWDGDGVHDLIIGTGRVSSVPAPNVGIPESLGPDDRQASALFLRNVGTNEEPVLAFPQFFRFREERMAFGIHTATPAAVDFGNGVLDLIVGSERGTITYYPRAEVTPR